MDSDVDRDRVEPGDRRVVRIAPQEEGQLMLADHAGMALIAVMLTICASDRDGAVQAKQAFTGCGHGWLVAVPGPR